jgi:hypothetical protein
MSKDLLKLALKNPAKARRKLSYMRNKRAAMEKPFSREYSLTKQANLSRTARGALLGAGGVLAAGPIANALGMTEGMAALAAKHNLGDYLASAPIKYGPMQLLDSLGLVGATKAITPGSSFIPGVGLAAGLGIGAEHALAPLERRLLSGTKPVAAIVESAAPQVAEKATLLSRLKNSSPKERALLAAAIFPWTAVGAGGAYLASKNEG